MSTDTIGYVVIEYNQASGQPDLAIEALFDTAGEAAERAHEFTETNRVIGRRETYAIGTVYIEED